MRIVSDLRYKLCNNNSRNNFYNGNNANTVANNNNNHVMKSGHMIFGPSYISSVLFLQIGPITYQFTSN
jgi:hypothetical protein